MRKQFLPYCLPFIGEEEIEEVADSIRSGWVTTGPKVRRFEESFARYVGAKHAIAVSSCTAALHLALASLGVGPGDEVIVPTLTFCATANVVVHLGATPVVVDVDGDCQISLRAVASALTPRTRAVIPVHFAGQTCELQSLLSLARHRGISVVEDAAHAAGASYQDVKVGTHGDAVAFSFYATKNMTTGEGGMITTGNDELAARIRLLALHGMSRDAWKRYSQGGSWCYEVLEAGYKSNMTDIQAAMGIHQLRRLDGFIERRRAIASLYDAAFSGLPEIVRPRNYSGRPHSYHLYPVQLRSELLSIDREQFIEELRRLNIGTSVHFIPLHRHPFYQRQYGYRSRDFPCAEHIYRGLLSLPLYPMMSDADVRDVIEAVSVVVSTHRLSERSVAAHA